MTPPKLSLAVQYASTAQNLPTRAQLRRWVSIALQRDVMMTLRIVDEDEGRELNKNYRGKDYATNVLTFVYDEDDRHGLSSTPNNESTCASRFPHPILPPEGEGENESLCDFHDNDLSGDVVICAPVVEREAQGKDLFAHYAHLAIHAALHLQGYEHENDSTAAQMEALETSLMLKLRYPDPYQATTTVNG